MKKYLFVNLYDAGAQRNEEFAECLERNKKAFDKVFVLSDTYYPDVENVFYKGDLTIDDIIREVNRHDGDINVIANADVWFEEFPDLSCMTDNTIYALTRYENGAFFCREDSADAWMFRGKIRLQGCNFRLGLRGTDNAIASRALAQGYKFVNPSLDIKIHHVHAVRTANVLYAPKPYNMNVKPATLKGGCLLFVTSINPFDRVKEQAEAVLSWVKFDKNVRILSFNTRKEADLLKDRFNEVIFVERNDAIEGKYQRLSTIISAVKHIEADWYVLINSDICIRPDSDFGNNLFRDSFLLGVRKDIYSEDRGGDLFPWGYDVFAMRRRHLLMLDNRVDYAIGLPWWDFYVPLMMIKNGERIFVDKTSFLHRWHKTRYDYSKWVSLCDYSKRIGCFVEYGLSRGEFCKANKEYIENHLES